MTVGADLATARSSRGLTVDDISDATSIRAAVVAAIEADDFAPSGGPAYARGHVRAIARFLGLDSASIVAAFDLQVEGFDEAPIAHRLVRSNAAEVELTRPTRIRWARLVALVVLCCGVAAVVAVLAHSLVSRH